MKISFVIPAYNEENYLGKCLDSVIQETKKAECDFEIIVVNNASTDKTKQVALSHAGVFIVDEPQKGLSQARQSGFLACNGDLIANIDADTLLPEGWIKTVLNEFKKDPLLVGLSGPHIFYDLGKPTGQAIKFFYWITFLGYFINRHLLRVGSFLQGGNFVLKKTALQTIGGFNPNFKFYGEDADIARRLHKIGHVKFTFKLPIYASARRLQSEGKTKMAFRYTINYLWTIFLGRPFTKTYIDVRTQK